MLPLCNDKSEEPHCLPTSQLFALNHITLGHCKDGYKLYPWITNVELVYTLTVQLAAWVVFVKLQPTVQLHINILHLSHCSRYIEPAVAHAVMKIAEGLSNLCMTCLLLFVFTQDACEVLLGPSACKMCYLPHDNYSIYR